MCETIRKQRSQASSFSRTATFLESPELQGVRFSEFAWVKNHKTLHSFNKNNMLKYCEIHEDWFL